MQRLACVQGIRKVIVEENLIVKAESEAEANAMHCDETIFPPSPAFNLIWRASIFVERSTLKVECCVLLEVDLNCNQHYYKIFIEADKVESKS